MFQNNLLNSDLLLHSSFYIGTSLFDIRSFLIICYAFCQCQDKVANLLTSFFTRSSIINFRKEKYFFYQTPEKATPEKPTLLRFVTTDIYLNNK